MDIGSKTLSQLVFYSKYAQYREQDQRREVFRETVERNLSMHVERFPHLRHELTDAYALVEQQLVLPSMRSMQFAGRAALKNHARMYNCAYLPITNPTAFAEIMFLLLSGCGVGFSVQARHVYQLPTITAPGQPMRYLIGDSIEGWADAVRHLCKAYFKGGVRPVFDYSDIRPKGAPLSSGGLAPGPEPLRQALEDAETLLRSVKPGHRLTPLECHDFICHLSESVRAGGIRRSALISLFDLDNREMLFSKTPEQLELNPQRYRANNSVILDRRVATYQDFNAVWSVARQSGTGEPGVFWTWDAMREYGTNPCAEISLHPYQFCNLCELNMCHVDAEYHYGDMAWAGALIGTVQATYTNFHYLRPIWREITQRDALLGIGMTGVAGVDIAQVPLVHMTEIIRKTNSSTALSLGINEAARLTTVKPSGTASSVLGTSSGIHAWHSDHYVRRLRVGKDEPLGLYLHENHASMLIASVEKPDTEWIVELPIKAPDGAITREESAMNLLGRVGHVYDNWIKPGHRRGPNTHNVSCTVNLREHEWDDVRDWLWNHKDQYAAMSCYPFSDAVYAQAPFEAITPSEYAERVAGLPEVDLSTMSETDPRLNRQEEVACGGGACEITHL